MAVELIAHTEVGSGGAANIEFTSIPGTYDDLWILLSTRVAGGSYIVNNRIRFNGDAGSNYSRTAIYAYSNTVASSRNTNAIHILYGVEPGATATSNTFGNSSIYIANYSITTNYKQLIADTGPSNNSTSNWQNEYVAGLWRSTSAITSIRLENPSSNLAQYSTATLYGITKA
jgi:hypothetical protein